MKKRRLFLCVLIGMLALLVIACKRKVANELPDDNTTTLILELTPTLTPTLPPTKVPTPTITPIVYESIIGAMTEEEYPLVDGSTATLPLSEAVFRLATGATKERTDQTIIHTKTTNAYYRLIDKEVDLLIVYEPSEEVLEYIKKNNYELEIKKIGKDALVFMTNTKNPVQSLSHHQIQKIYDGTIKNWSEVGGENKELLAFQRPENSGSQTLMQKLVMGDLKMVQGDNIIRYEAMVDIIDGMVELGAESNTLGYSVFYYAQNMYQKPDLKFVAVDGVVPSNESIQDGSYPYINGFYAVVRKAEPSNSNARRIFEWLTMEEGQSLIQSLGYVPVKQGTFTDSHSEEESAKTPIPEGYVYMTTSYTGGIEISYGRVNLYRGNWELIKSFPDAYVTRESGLLKVDSKFVIATAERGDNGKFESQFGLYSIEREEFIIPPKYDGLYALNSERGFYYAEENIENGTRSCVIDEEQRVLQENLPTNEAFRFSSVTPNGYWYFDYRYTFFDGDWNKIITIEPPSNNESYAEVLYSESGVLLLNRKNFLETLGKKDDKKAVFYIERYEPFLRENEELYVVRFADYYYLMNREGKNLASCIASDRENFLYYIQYEFYQYEQDGLYYNKDGELLTGPTGKYYNQLDTEWLYTEWLSLKYVFSRREGESIYWWRYGTDTEYALKASELKEPMLRSAIQNYCVITDNLDSEKNMIYYKEDKMMDLSGWGYFLENYNLDGISKVLYWRNDERLEECEYLFKDGEVKYKTNENEKLVHVDDTFIQLVRGNFNIVMDYDGNYMVKELHVEYMED